MGAASQPGKPVYGLQATVGGRMVIIAGGLPVSVDGEFVSAIGVSTGSPDQDMAVAEAGIEAFMKFNNEQICSGSKT